MNTKFQNRHPRGYASLLTVFTVSIFMVSMMIFSYTRAVNNQSALADIQTQTDYQEKEEAILRSIVSITPNRAIRAMQSGSDVSSATRNPLSFDSIFKEAIIQSNARTSVSEELLKRLNIETVYSGNSGDSGLSSMSKIFGSLDSGVAGVTSGLMRDLGQGFPPALNLSAGVYGDNLYPIITTRKIYGSYANGRVGLPPSDYKDFNLIPYPQIDFGYAQPGEMFVAKRNWWAFTMDLAGHDSDLTQLKRQARTFVLSIYEIPSQLPISASSFLALGEHANGQAWGDVTIEGNVFAGKAVVEGDTVLPSLASRRGFELSTGTTIGGQSFIGNPFTPGVIENFRLTEGEFFPVSLVSESGNAAFVPINRGADFFDRYAHQTESRTVSPTAWNNYSVGALQCAMRLDITKCVSAADPTPTEVNFSYLKNGSRQNLTISFDTGPDDNVPAGYIYACREYQSRFFATPVDVAYGGLGEYYFKNEVSGLVEFNNQTFGDPIVGYRKYGYYRPLYPFEIKSLPNGQTCVAVYPERFKEFLTLIGADGPEVNNSLALNVDYVNNNNLTKPSIPCTLNDYGAIIQECRDLTDFTNGFSFVTNLRLYIGDDYNVVPTTPPADYTPPNGSNFYPPTSLFAPEKRFGVNRDPLEVEFSGQVGSVASENIAEPIRPLDAKGVSGLNMKSAQLKINLSKINHPAELPPITMKNWLVVVEEKLAQVESQGVVTR
ncbi:MAG: hypothetical protein AB8D78_15500 [Akkermansiaceae bacterium]